MKGNQHLFEINKHSSSECIDVGRSPHHALMRRQRQRVFMRKEKGTITSIEERPFYWCRWHSAADSKNVFNFWSGSHQPSSQNISFLIILANTSLGHVVALGSSRGGLPVWTSQRVRYMTCKEFPWRGSSGSVVKGPHLYHFDRFRTLLLFFGKVLHVRFRKKERGGGFCS